MCILFVNPIGKDISLEVINKEEHVVIQSTIIPKTGNDFEILPKNFVDIVKNHNIKEIWCITGPGSFTLMRIITLILNSISYNSDDIVLKSGHYFDIIQSESHVPILEANRHEYLIRMYGDQDLMIKKPELPSGNYVGYIDDTNVTGYIPYTMNLSDVITYFQGTTKVSRLTPIYIKSPNITLGSQKTSLQNS